MKDPEARPATVDIPAIFSPHDEGGWIPLNRTLKLNGASDPHGLSVSNLLRYTWGTCRQRSELLQAVFMNNVIFKLSMLVGVFPTVVLSCFCSAM